MENNFSEDMYRRIAEHLRKCGYPKKDIDRLIGAMKKKGLKIVPKFKTTK